MDHTAIAVRSIQSALPLYRDLLGGVPNGFERQSERGFAWLTLGYPNGSQVELLEHVAQRERLGIHIVQKERVDAAQRTGS